MPKIQCRRAIDAPSGDMHAIVAALSRLTERTVTRDDPSPVDATLDYDTLDYDTLDYDASIEVFDVAATGRVLVVWTATFSVRHVCPSVVQRYRDAAFTDFVGQLQLEWPAMADIAS